VTEYTPPHHGKSLAEKMWDRLDELVDQVKGNPGNDEAELKARANEMASVVLLMCLPHYKSAREVLVEAQKRWRIRQKEIPFEPTPGYKYNPPPPGTPYRPAAATKKDVPKKEVPKFPRVDPKNVHAIKAMHSAGFSLTDLANVYGLTEAHVQHLVTS